MGPQCPTVFPQNPRRSWRRTDLLGQPCCPGIQREQVLGILKPFSMSLTVAEHNLRAWMEHRRRCDHIILDVAISICMLDFVEAWCQLAFMAEVEWRLVWR